MSGSSDQGFLPCFSKHNDSSFPIESAYSNKTFITKLELFVQSIITSPNTQVLKEKIHCKGGIQPINPNGNSTDKKLCQQLGWQSSKVYRVDYGDNPCRLLFGLDNESKRCYILALDSNHDTRPGKRK